MPKNAEVTKLLTEVKNADASDTERGVLFFKKAMNMKSLPKFLECLMADRELLG